jgi:hypothetical protein
VVRLARRTDRCRSGLWIGPPAPGWQNAGPGGAGVPVLLRAGQSSSPPELEFELELEFEELLDELFELELDELLELEFDELFELELEELFEFELDEPFEFELDELFELELDEPFLPPPDHQLSSSATRTNSSCWLVAVPPGLARCVARLSTWSIWRAWTAPVVPRSTPRAAVVSQVILLMGDDSL